MARVLHLLLVCYFCVCYADAARILLIPFFNTSHFLEMDGVGRPLVERGHDVHILLDSDATLKTNRYKIIKFKSTNFFAGTLSPEFQNKFIENTQGGQDKEMSLIFNAIKGVCTNLMEDEAAFTKLKSLNFDIAIVDNFFAHCFFLIPYKLGIPYATVGSLVTALNMRLPVLASVVQPVLGMDFFGLSFCEETDGQSMFVRRSCRLLAFIMQEVFMRTIEEDYLHKYADFTSMEQVRSNFSVALVNQLNLLSSPLPKLPHVEYVGGLTTSPAKPLPKDLDDWMNQAPNVVVVSFGSRFSSLPAAYAKKVFEAFGKLPKLRFLFRFIKSADSQDLVIPKNVRLMDWLPQNDALGHNNTRLFITHSGNNGQQEALFHGVPMLCFYIAADQKSNAKRVNRLGYGKMLDLHNFSVDELAEYLEELTSNTKYREKIQKASRIFHSQRHPSQRAADAIEHVLKYGAEHLRPKEAYKLTWWQFYMLDILAILYVALVFSLVVTYKILKCTLRRCCGKREKKTKTE